MVTKLDIKKRRENLGLFQEDIANYVGVSVATVSRWERGEIASIKSTHVKKLAEILKVQPTDILNADPVKLNANFTPQEESMIYLFRKASARDRKLIMDILAEYDFTEDDVKSSNSAG